GTSEDEEPYMIYYHTSPNGDKEKGTNLVIEIDFDPAQSMFIEGFDASDVNSSALEALLESLNFKSQWAHDQKHNDGVEGGDSDHFAAMTATVSVALSAGSEPPKDENDL